MGRVAACLGMGLVLLVGVGGVSGAARGGEPRVRVRLLQRDGPVRVGREGDAGSLVRAAPGGGGLRVDGRPIAGPARFAGDRAVVVDGTRYRGLVEIHRHGSGIVVVNEVALDDYVAGTLHRELYPSWEGEALRAQAVVVRTYALYHMARPGGRLYHLEAGPRSQVYGGLDAETPAARRAVRATRGEYLAFDGRPILAVFHSAAGGRTASAEEVWGEAVPYLVSIEVQGEERSPDTYWRIELPASRVARALGEVGVRVGTLRDLRVVERTPSGRVRRVQVEGSQGRTMVEGRLLRQALGGARLRSTLYEIRRDGPDFVFLGSGHGHGVGLSQWGARAMAARGASYREILARFFPGTRLRQLGPDRSRGPAARGADHAAP